MKWVGFSFTVNARAWRGMAHVAGAVLNGQNKKCHDVAHILCLFHTTWAKTTLQSIESKYRLTNKLFRHVRVLFKLH